MLIEEEKSTYWLCSDDYNDVDYVQSTGDHCKGEEKHLWIETQISVKGFEL